MMTQAVLAAGVREKKRVEKLENKEYDCTAETETQSAMYVPLVGVGVGLGEVEVVVRVVVRCPV